jgi:hypothetical protein
LPLAISTLAKLPSAQRISHRQTAPAFFHKLSVALLAV